MNIKNIISILLISTAVLSACQKNSTTKGSDVLNEITLTSDSANNMKQIATNTKETLYGDYQESDYNEDTNKIDTTITLKENKATIEGKGAEEKDNQLIISTGGNYLLKGDYKGQIQIDTKEAVHLILDNVTLENQSGPALYIVNSEQTVVTLAPNSTNTIVDGAKYTNGEEETSAIFSKSDLTFNGTGNLKVQGNYKNAIQSKDNLTFMNGTYQITAENNGLKGKDKVAILNGTYTIETTSGDAIQGSNDTDSKKGFVAIDGGNFTIHSGSDGIQAETSLYFQGDSLKITTESQEDTSLKGLKAGAELVVESGKIEINALDDALHSNGNVTINGGDLTLTSEDDGIHGDQTLTINDGKIKIGKSYEGLEASQLTINGGEIDIYATDDGINAASSSSDETTNEKDTKELTKQPTKNENGRPDDMPTPPDGEMEMPQGQGQAPGDNSKQGDPGFGGGGPMEESDGSLLEINGGKITVSADGDGVDSNGDIVMTGGELTVFGPENGGNSTLDYSGTFTMKGGLLFGIGSSGMAQSVSKESTQKNFEFYLNAATTAKKVTISQNQQILGEVTPTKTFQHLVFSSERLVTGEVTVTVDDQTYQVNLTDEVTSFNQDGSTYTMQQGMGPRGGR